jgi:hypothetical protein
VDETLRVIVQRPQHAVVFHDGTPLAFRTWLSAADIGSTESQIDQSFGNYMAHYDVRLER